MKIFNTLKKNKGFVLLFAIILSSIILAVALGVTEIAFKEVQFGTDAKNTNDAFFAADTGAECALYYDKFPPGPNRFVTPDPGGAISCASTTTSPTFSGGPTTWTYSYTIINLGSLSKGCAKVTIAKDMSSGTLKTRITSKGYNIGNSSCASPNPSRVERVLQVDY